MGAWEQIVDYTVPSNTTSVDFTGLNITKDDFIKISFTFTGASSLFDIGYIYANQDYTNTNYYRQVLRANASTVAADRENQPRFISKQDGSNITSQSFAYLKLSENGKMNVFSNNNINTSSLVENWFEYVTSTSTFNSITELRIASFRSNGIATNSRIQIYKLAAEKVADVVVNANTTQVDITGLDIKKGDEYLLVSDVLTSASGEVNLNLYVNNNTTNSNYYNQGIIGNGSSTTAFRSNQTRFLDFGANKKGLSYTHIKLSNIGAYTHQSYSIFNYGDSDMHLRNLFVSSTAENITSINQLNIGTNRNNSIGTGSRFELYKLYEGGN